MFADGTSGSQAYEGYIGYDHNLNQMQLRANNNINFNTNSGDRMRIDSSGNVGITSTPATDWHTDYKALQIGHSSAFFGKVAGTEAFFSSNAKYTSGGWKYIATGTANLIDMQTGVTRFRSAVSGTAGNAISLSTNMIIDASGKVGIGTTNFITTGAKLQVKGTSASPGISGSNFTGSIFSVEGTSTVNISMGTTGASSYDGWIQVHDAGTGTNYDLLLNPIGGNVGIGTSAPLAKLHVQGNAVIGNVLDYETTHPGESGATLHVHNLADDGADTDGKVNFGDENTSHN